MARRRISQERQALYYVGLGLSGLGALLFISVLIGSALQFGDFTDFEERTRSFGVRAVVGMILIAVGAVVQRVGAAGAAGSGILLDPERARRDLEPFSRQAGGMLSDALDESGLRRPNESNGTSSGQVMVRCLACDQLNEEDSKFCQECGERLRPPG